MSNGILIGKKSEIYEQNSMFVDDYIGLDTSSIAV